MPSLKDVEKQIYDVEDFRVAFRRESATTQKWRNVRSDLKGIPAYVYERQAGGLLTVKAWRDRRCQDLFVEPFGLVPEVVFYDGTIAPAKTLLKTVRASYPRRRRK